MNKQQLQQTIERQNEMYGTKATAHTSLKDKYVVWSPEAEQPPQYCYGSRPDAIKLAHLMATKNPGQRFAVCKIVGCAQTKQVAFESYED
jgi:hypothetical protein